MDLTKKLKYLFSKINFSASFFDAKAIEIFNGIETHIEKEMLEKELNFYKKTINKINLIKSGELNIDDYTEELTVKILSIEVKLESIT